MKIYLKYLDEQIKNPKQLSLVHRGIMYENNFDEILHQIPHWIFPIVGTVSMSFPRLLLVLNNHPHILSNLIDELKNSDLNEASSIYNLSYLRKCILEMLRLNNPVVTTFRNLLKDYNFTSDETQYKYKKGEQFLILNNPVLRDEEYFKHPDQYIPERWSSQTEKSYYSIMFNKGPQECPGKELSIFIIMSCVVNYFRHTGLLEKNIWKLTEPKINSKKIQQMINPFSIKFEYI